MHPSFRVVAALAVSAVLAGGAPGQQSRVSDAAIQANVLKAMAADNRLASQPIQTSTAFGTVTLTGSVPDENTRNTAEQVVAHTAGVQKVVDQLSVGNDVQAAASSNAEAEQAANEEAGLAALNEAEGTAQQQAAPDAPPSPQAPGSPGAPGSGQRQQAYPQQPYPQQNYPQQNPQQGYPQQAYPQQSSPQQQYPQADPRPLSQQGYPPQSPHVANRGYSQQPVPGMYRRQYEAQRQAAQQAPYGYAPQGGQAGGQRVVIAPGVVLPVRISRWLSSGDAQPGSIFTAVVESDILAGNQIAIPRGAQVEGVVADARDAGVLKGRGSLTLQLTSLHLRTQNIPLQSATFTVTGHDKAAQSVNSAIGGAAIGAILGAIAGRGTGAAIGAGVGGAAGLGISAASRRGEASLPPEALLQFPLTAPTELFTVSEAEMQRLGSFAGPEGMRRPNPPRNYGYGAYPAPAPYAYPPGYYERNSYPY